MPVYPVAARDASCASPGCWCQDRVPRYPSDLTDEQWAVLEPRAREVMAELTATAGRPMVHDLRAVCDAVAYVVRNGIEWRALPVDFLLVTWNHSRVSLRLGRLCTVTSPQADGDGGLAGHGCCDVGGQVAGAGQARAGRRVAAGVGGSWPGAWDD